MFRPLHWAIIRSRIVPETTPFLPIPTTHPPHWSITTPTLLYRLLIPDIAYDLDYNTSFS